MRRKEEERIGRIPIRRNLDIDLISRGRKIHEKRDLNGLKPLTESKLRSSV